jgi:hypothetical protein
VVRAARDITSSVDVMEENTQRNRVEQLTFTNSLTSFILPL